MDFGERMRILRNQKYHSSSSSLSSQSTYYSSRSRYNSSNYSKTSRSTIKSKFSSSGRSFSSKSSRSSSSKSQTSSVSRQNQSRSYFKENSSIPSDIKYNLSKVEENSRNNQNKNKNSGLNKSTSKQEKITERSKVSSVCPIDIFSGPQKSLEKASKRYENVEKCLAKSPRNISEHSESGFGKFNFGGNGIQVINENVQEIKTCTNISIRNRLEFGNKVPSMNSKHMELNYSLMRFIMDSKNCSNKPLISSKSSKSNVHNLPENFKKAEGKSPKMSKDFLKPRKRFQNLEDSNSETESSKSFSLRSNSRKSQSSRSKRSRDSSRFYDKKDENFNKKSTKSPSTRRKITSAIYLSQFIINRRKYFSRYRSRVYQKNLGGNRPFGEREPSPSTSESSSNSSSKSSDLIFSYRKIYQESISSKSSYRVRSPVSRKARKLRKSSSFESEKSSVEDNFRSINSVGSRKKFHSRSKISTSRYRSKSRK